MLHFARPSLRAYAVALFPKRPPTCLVKERPNLVGMTLTDLHSILSLTKFKTYRASQIYAFLYRLRGSKWWDAEALPKDMRTWLADSYSIDAGKIGERHDSEDGLTRRYIIETETRSKMETVIVRNEQTDRKTLCVSSQLGCSLACTFCYTGTQSFRKNLTSGEILAQFMVHSGSHAGHPTPITNVVFMGQGEPLYNWRNVAAAVEILTDPKGLGLGHSKVTISTSGIAPLIPKIGSELGVGLAISLHAPNDSLRSRLMAINNTYPLPVLMESCKAFLEASPAATRRISFEYVMLRGLNDSSDLAAELSALLKSNFDPQHVHVNLLPFNEWPGAPYKCSPVSVIEAFKNILTLRGIACTVRTPKGRDIMAACGQLSANSQLSENTLLNTDIHCVTA